MPGPPKMTRAEREEKEEQQGMKRMRDRRERWKARVKAKRTDPTARMMPTKAKKPKRTVTSKEDVKHQLRAGARQTGQAIGRGFSRMTPIGPLRRRSR